MQWRRWLSPRRLTILLLFVCLIGLILGLLSGWRHANRFLPRDNAYANMLFNVRWMTGLFGIFPISLFFIRLSKERKHFLSAIRTWLPLRSAVYFGFAAIATNSICFGCGLLGESGYPMRSFFYSSYIFWAGLWVLLCIGMPNFFIRAERGTFHVLDLCLVNLILVLLLLEGGLQLWAPHSHSPFFWDVSSIESTLKKYRQKPKQPYFNSFFNSQGYHDKEFFNRKENDFVVALLADSFGMGVVPYDFNFVSVAEKALQEKLSDRFQSIAIHNFGIPSIGMREYAYLLTTEVLQLCPNLVLLCVFVGNDIGGYFYSKNGWQCFQGWFLWTVANRVLALLREVSRGRGVVPIGEPMEKTLGTKGGKLPSYLFDNSLELPTFSEETFLHIESSRLEICNSNNPSTAKKFEEFFKVLQYIENLLKEKLVVVLIPDQFQVDNLLYDRILQTKGRPKQYIRNYPQERIKEYCLLHRIPVLDLLQPLILAEKEAKTYHLRDTHWNTHGNRVAGEAIASAILLCETLKHAHKPSPLTFIKKP